MNELKYIETPKGLESIVIRQTKAELVQDIIKKDCRYDDKKLYQLGNEMLARVRQSVREGLFIAYADINHRALKLFKKGLNLAYIDRVGEIHDDLHIRIIYTGAYIR
jgi:hypothetical protein